MIKSHPARGGTDTLENLQQLAPAIRSSKKPPENNAIRLKAIRDTAQTIGAQAGLAWRSRQINAVLHQQSKNLDRIFDFNSMLLDNNVLPPVLEEGSQDLHIDNESAIRLADRSYQIVKQARFVSAAPNWRSYLWMNFSPPQRPNATLLPKDEEEQKIWAEYVEQGWHEGIKQANDIYDANLARAKRDLKGMVIYRQLLAQHIVSPPYVARARLGVTGGGQSLRVNDQVLRITALPQLQANSHFWQPVISPTDPKKQVR
ncbi:MAG: type IVB secretion system protein DotC [Gammaproteobacteria bacterium]